MADTMRREQRGPQTPDEDVEAPARSRQVVEDEVSGGARLLADDDESTDHALPLRGVSTQPWCRSRSRRAARKSVLPRRVDGSREAAHWSPIEAIARVDRERKEALFRIRRMRNDLACRAPYQRAVIRRHMEA